MGGRNLDWAFPPPPGNRQTINKHTFYISHQTEMSFLVFCSFSKQKLTHKGPKCGEQSSPKDQLLTFFYDNQKNTQKLFSRVFLIILNFRSCPSNTLSFITILFIVPCINRFKYRMHYGVHSAGIIQNITNIM